MQTINLNLHQKTFIIPVLHAKQGDVGRKFQVVFDDGIPENVTFSAWYSGASGAGNYTHIGDASAFAIDGNTVTVELITQMLTNAGEGKLCLVMAGADGSQLGTWNIPYMVEFVPGMGSQKAQQYFSILAESAERATASAQEAANSAAKAVQAAETLETDTSLSVPGVAADAKVTGERIAAVQIVCSASGEVVTVNDASGNPLEGLTLCGKTTQDGIPTPETPIDLVSVGDGGSVGVKVCGKNLLPNTATTKTVNGITFTINDDGSVTANGTATATAILGLPVELAPHTSYKITGCPVGGGGGSCVLMLMDTITSNAANDTGAGLTWTTEDNTSHVLRIRIASGATLSNLTFYPMIRLASIEDDAYEPYKNGGSLSLSTPNGLPGIPVSSGGNYTDADGQQWICDEIDLARGVYVQRVKRKRVSSSVYWSFSSLTNRFFLDDSDYNKAPATATLYALCSHFTPLQNAQIVDMQMSYINDVCPGFAYRYDALNGDIDAWNAFLDENEVYIIAELATPIETALSAEEIAAFKALHTNKPNTTVYTDSNAGIKLDYVADTKTYIDNKFAELAAAIVNNT